MNINIINLVFIFTLKINSITMMEFYFHPSNTINNHQENIIEGKSCILRYSDVKTYRIISHGINNASVYINYFHNKISFSISGSTIFTITKNSFTSELISFKFNYNSNTDTNIVNNIWDTLNLNFHKIFQKKIFEKTIEIIDFMFKEREFSELKKEHLDSYTKTLFNLCHEIYDQILLL